MEVIRKYGGYVIRNVNMDAYMNGRQPSKIELCKKQAVLIALSMV